MSFSDDIARFTAATEKAADKIVGATTLELFAGIIKDTPVDTGRARGDWQTTVATPAADENDRIDPSGAQAIAEAVAGIPLKAGQEVFLTNNLPYIEDLEYGSSPKAPQGMVRRNLARAVRIASKAIAKFRV
ncbi:HK97 gp10 family phage protein [Pseudomonas nitroreducens]|uniref:HK97 gp10 family phage protein n=1 Tax=Pseudomonas nitroreducens TaxID=46680 RepID=UPI00351D4686